MEIISETKKSGKRLKTLLKNTHCSQKELAQFLNYAPNHISMIVTGKRKLTAETARKIIENYSPETRFEWLLGWDDFETEKDVQEYVNSIEPVINTLWDEDDAAEAFLKALGYTWKLSNLRSRKNGEFEFSKINDYCFSYNNKPIFQCSQDDIFRVKDEIIEFAKFKVEMLRKERGNCDG